MDTKLIENALPHLTPTKIYDEITKKIKKHLQLKSHYFLNKDRIPII